MFAASRATAQVSGGPAQLPETRVVGVRSSRVDTVLIDARKDNLTDGWKRVSTRHDIVLLVQNVNPFIHQYRIYGSKTSYAENAIGAFATALGLPVTVPPAPTASAAGSDFSNVSSLLEEKNVEKGKKKKKAEVPLPPAYCGPKVTAANGEAAAAQATALESMSDAVLAKGKILHDSLEALNALLRKGATARATADSLKDGTLTSEELLQRVHHAYPVVSNHISALTKQAAPLGPQVSDYNGMLASFYTLASKLAETYPACGAFADARSNAATWLSDTSANRAVVTAATAQVTELTTIRDAMARVERSPESTRMQRVFGNFDDPTVVELIVQRSPTGPDTMWRAIATPRLSFGSRRRFAIGVGGLESNVSVSTYDVATRYRQAPQGQPGDTTERVIVETGDSHSRVTPIIVLSARLTSLPTTWLDGLHLSFGTAPRETGSKLTMDYLVGLGLSAADERILLSVGAASVEQTTLADNYKVEDRLPSSQSSVPTRKSRLFKPAVAISFRVF